jgi:hypothetical protein
MQGFYASKLAEERGGTMNARMTYAHVCWRMLTNADEC